MPETLKTIDISTVRKLDIGAGVNRRDTDYTTVDFYHEAADIKAEMWDMPMIAENTIEEIWAEHCLEHIPIVKVAPTLKEWFRVLKPGGRAIVSVPNFDYVAKYWLTGPDRLWAEMMVFGNQAHDGEFHKCAFSPALLRGDCEAAGFKVKYVNILWTHNQETLRATCIKEPAGSKP